MGSTIAMIMAAVMLVVISIVLTWRSRLYRGATGGKG
jgi:putative spermidine/putrescine transport system permease protein